MSTPERNESDVTRLLKQIDTEYQAAQLALSGLALGTSMHGFITARLVKIEEAREQLVEMIGDEMEATRLVCEQLDQSAEAKEGE